MAVRCGPDLEERKCKWCFDPYECSCAFYTDQEGRPEYLEFGIGYPPESYQADSLDGYHLAEMDNHTYSDIYRERWRQDMLNGGPQNDDLYDIPVWASLIGARACELILTDFDKRREELVKIAALAVAALESIDRKEKKCPSRDSNI